MMIPYAQPDPNRQSIVVMGGSFNPPTLAHQRLMLAAVEAVGAVRGIFVPSKHSYVSMKMSRQHMETEILSEETRLAMLESMCAEDERLTVDACEFGRDDRAKTYETMETLQQKYPDAVLYFVAGGDKMQIIPRWHRAREFLERFRIMVVKRDGISPEAKIAKNDFLSRYAEAFVLLNEPDGLEGISSTQVRYLLRIGDESAAQMVHPGVWELLLKEGWLNPDINRFRGEYDYLSNFYEADVEYAGLTYRNAEAAFQAQKCESEAEKEAFCSLPSNKAKKLGRRVKLRADWEEVKDGLMLEIVRAKFRQNPGLAQKLLDTGDRKLVEGNTWHDVYWGVDLRTGQGENHLGKILMQVRSELQAENS